MRERITRLAFCWGPPFLWAGFIFALSSLSFQPREPSFALEDKVVHGILFAVLALFLFRAFRRDLSFARPKALIAAFLLTVLYAGVDEVHQWFTPTRTVDFSDWIADTVGAGLALVLALVVASRRTPSRNVPGTET